MQTNIETIYQQHIKPLSQKEQIKLLAKMAEELANSWEENELQKKRSMTELDGLGEGNAEKN